MPKVTFQSYDGTRQTIDAIVGDSLMGSAVDHGIEGIIGECGGTATCGTCYVYVDPESLPDVSVLPPMSGREAGVIDGSLHDRRDTSRLACQLPVTDELDGLVVEVPEAAW